ncbi:MAG TPA: MBL fold metallo-hydrolase [Longimicrobiales bacterium]|nr:MBL fold metallo-hydrolase [Longimicrobiales bacterium]
MHWKSLRGILLAVALVLCTAAALAAQALEIRFLDVGQGDAVLVQSGGKTALIDAGPADAVAGRLRKLGVTSLDLLLASHNHSDHIGGADAVLERFPVRFYLDNGQPATTRIQSRVLRLVQRKGVTYLKATPRTIELGSAKLHILPSPLAGRTDEQNDQSVVVLVEQGSFRALLAGDAEVDEINALLATDFLPDVDVLKADHHGSRNGVTPAWLARTKPEVIVISVGAGNSYGHPHAQALRYYQAGGRRVYRTDRDGDVVVQVDTAGTYRVSTRTGTKAGSSSSAGPAVLSPRSPPGPAPARSEAASTGATARCRDGTFSFARTHRGACSHHSGVAVWLDGGSPRR